jgi:alkylhydroperoxidase/carboxymuconolactone decarboxylase family protein YurZ
VHVRGALRNGLSEEEIREALLQVGVYCCEGFHLVMHGNAWTRVVCYS